VKRARQHQSLSPPAHPKWAEGGGGVTQAQEHSDAASEKKPRCRSCSWRKFISCIYGASETQTFYLPHTIAFKVHAPAQQHHGHPSRSIRALDHDGESYSVSVTNQQDLTFVMCFSIISQLLFSAVPGNKYLCSAGRFPDEGTKSSMSGGAHWSVQMVLYRCPRRLRAECAPWREAEVASPVWL
jgi:hypothetical protein